jgi:hypothetical protein
MARIGFDCDGVLDTFGDGLHEAMIARGLGHYWKSGPTLKSRWDFFDEWGWTKEKFKETVDWGVDQGIIFSGHWREGATESVKRVAELGHEIIIITDRSWGTDPMNSQRNTIEAFARAGIEYDELIFSADKTVGNVDMMVEDKWENFQACTDFCIDTYLITRAWNEDRGPHPKRINSVTDYADIVEEKTKAGLLDLSFA